MRRLRFDVSRKAASQAFEKPAREREREREREEEERTHTSAMVTTEDADPRPRCSQPLKFGFHCFAARTFIDFRRRTVMDAAFIVIVERTPLPSLSLQPSLLYPCSKKFYPPAASKFDFHRGTFETSGHGPSTVAM